MSNENTIKRKLICMVRNDGDKDYKKVEGIKDYDEIIIDDEQTASGNHKMNKAIALQEDGPIVAAQYPATVDFSSTEDTGRQLAKKYGHLRQLGADDKAGYNELKEAIKDVKSRKTELNKQEDVIKKPLNSFRSLVIDTAKKIRGSIVDVENMLNAEKTRIDDIRAEKLAAQQRLWNDNLMFVRNLVTILNVSSIDYLNSELLKIDKFDINSLDFGDLIEDAKAELANARIRIETAIEQEKQQIEFRIQQEEFNKKLAEQAEKDRIASEEKAKAEEAAAEAAADNARLKAELEALKATEDQGSNLVESGPFVTPSHHNPEVHIDIQAPSGLYKRGSSRRPLELVEESTAKDYTNMAAQSPSLSYKKDDPLWDDKVSDDDILAMSEYIIYLNAAKDLAPIFQSTELNAAMNRVSKSLLGATDFLTKVLNDCG